MKGTRLILLSFLSIPILVTQLYSQNAGGIPKTKTFTILHTNDLHSSFIGMGPSSDYSPFEINNDETRGGYARLGGLIARKKALHQSQGAVLVLDAGDYSMGTPFGAATRETGCELQMMARMGYDATTFGNHDFDLGPGGLAMSIKAAVDAGFVTPVIASNTNLDAGDSTLSGLRKLASDGHILPYKVVERDGIRFGIFGLLGKEATFYTGGAGAVKFNDAVETARTMVKLLRDSLKSDVVICLSHGGLQIGADGRFSAGDDVHLAETVPGIDIIIGGHSHTALRSPVVIKYRTVILQAGKEGQNLGELVMTVTNGKTRYESWKLNPVNDAVKGDTIIANAIEQFKPLVTKTVFNSRGFSIDQPLAIVPKDLPNTYTNIAAGTILANLVTDAFRSVTHADIGFTANGMLRAPLKRGKTGVQTVYDIFAIAPLGAGIVDPTAGSALVTAYFTGRELKNILEFLLVDNPSHPGEYFPRCSGLKFTYDTARPKYDVVTGIELGEFSKGYKTIDISGTEGKLYSLTCPLYLGMIIVAIPGYTKGLLTLQPKNALGIPLKSKVEALALPDVNLAEMLPPAGIKLDNQGAVLRTNSVTEVKEWQAIMDYMHKLPVVKGSQLPVIPVDERAVEVRYVLAGSK
jgi:5'-nucleotidase